MSQNLEANSGPVGKVVWSASGAVVLQKMKVEIPTNRIHRAIAGERTYLVLRNMSARHAVGTIYQVFLKGAAGKEILAGTFNFFNLERSIDSVPGELPGSVRQFDVTGIVGKLPGKLVISIRAAQQPEAGSGATIGRMELLVAHER